MTKKELIVICVHLPIDKKWKQEKDFMQPMAGLHIASLIDKGKYNITLYHEMYHGPFDIHALEKKKYDVAILSGVIQKDFDRMRQLSFFFRKKGTIVIAGGSICTLFPEFSSQFFDVVGAGGVDSVRDILKDYENNTLRKIYYSPIQDISDYQLDFSFLKQAGINLPIHIMESSRGCNWRCAFCTLPAEKARHAPYKIENIVASIENAIDRAPLFSLRRIYPLIMFMDNDFSGNPIHMKALCDYLRKKRKIKAWGALVTQKTLQNRETIKLMRQSKCRIIFVGLESLDLEFIQSHRKLQNKTDVVSDIVFAQQQGIVVIYGYLFDNRTTSIEAMKKDINFLLNFDDLTFPVSFNFVAPLLGTDFFADCVEKHELIPNLRLRDLEGTTLTVKPKEPVENITEFASLLYDRLHLLAPKKILLKKTIQQILKFKYNPFLWLLLYKVNFRAHHIKHAKIFKNNKDRNYIGGWDILDLQYDMYPEDISREDFERYFAPVRITDENGDLRAWLRSPLP